jgi:hypothetical protein
MKMFEKTNTGIQSCTEPNPFERRQQARIPFIGAVEAVEKDVQMDGSTERDPHERRRHTRYPLTVTVEAVEGKSRTRIQGRTSDLSRGGCYVDTISSFPAGSVVKMRLTKDTRSFEAQAEVVYSLVGMGMGVKFTSGDPQQLLTLEKWVGELSGKLLPESELPQSSDPSRSPASPGNIQYSVLNELITELTIQGVLSTEKSKAMLHKLNRGGTLKIHSANA